MPSFGLRVLKLISNPIFMPANFMYVKGEGLVNAFDLLGAHEFEDQFVFHQNVNPVPAIEPNVLVLHRFRTPDLTGISGDTKS